MVFLFPMNRSKKSILNMKQKKMATNIKAIGIVILILVLAFIIYLIIHSSDKDEVIIPNNPPSQVCAQIAKKQKRNYCLAIVNKDRDLCNKTMEGDKLFCMAIVDNNPELCKKLKPSPQRKTCFTEVARINDNISSCNFADNKNSCIGSYFSGLYWDRRFDLIDKKYCEDFPDDGKVWCLALATQDKSVCGNLPACLSLFTQPLSFCNDQKVLSTKSLGQCLRDRAMSQRDPTICKLIDNRQERNDCYFNIVGHINPDTSFCSKISDRNLEQLCFLNAAIKLLLFNK